MLPSVECLKPSDNSNYKTCMGNYTARGLTACIAANIVTDGNVVTF